MEDRSGGPWYGSTTPESQEARSYGDGAVGRILGFLADPDIPSEKTERHADGTVKERMGASGGARPAEGASKRRPGG